MSGWEFGADGFPLFPGASGLDPVDPAQVDGVGDGLLLDLGDETFGLPASHVLDGLEEVAGVEESVTLSDDTGMTICSDTDGDGRVDAVSVVTFDGGWSSWRRQDCMAGVRGATEISPDVSSVTTNGEGTGESMLGEEHTEQGEHGAEQGRRDGEWYGVPPSTPGNGRGSWDPRGWECVDRGNWG